MIVSRMFSTLLKAEVKNSSSVDPFVFGQWEFASVVM